MQGKKSINPKMLYQVQINDLVSADNYYRRISREVDFSFLYKETEKYYGMEGQESIDPVVFFKICLIGYLNNINSDRRLIEYCADSLAIRLFIQYDIDEPLPWHSTVSRTRQLYGEEVFISLFKKILSLCISKGMVRGKRQAIDSAFIKANASLNSLVEKEILEDMEQYAQELNQGSEFKVSISKNDEQNKRKGSRKIKGKHIRPAKIPNQLYGSASDPDARIAFKPGKQTLFYYSGHVAVDDANHVITGAMADFANKSDHESLPQIADRTIQNLKEENIQMEQIVADTGYSSGEALRYCEKRNIDTYIPNHGGYLPVRDGFIYNEIEDRYECQQGNKAFLPFKYIDTRKSHYPQVKVYRSSKYACHDCPLHSKCINAKLSYKQIKHTIDKSLYDTMHRKMQTLYAKRIMRRRSSTVEPVLGSLINYTSMKQLNTKGINQANKHVLMAALTYNLKKYMAFYTAKTVVRVKEIRRKLQVNALNDIFLGLRPLFAIKVTHK